MRISVHLWPKRSEAARAPDQARPRATSTPSSTGRYSRRHKVILEAILEVPEAREALIGVMKRNRQRQKQAELEAAYILMRWLATNNPQFLPAALDQACPEWEAGSGGGHERAANNLEVSSGETPRARNDQTQIDQLAASLRAMNESLKRRLLRKTTKKRTPNPKQQPDP